jgi:hypothetical protein
LPHNSWCQCQINIVLYKCNENHSVICATAGIVFQSYNLPCLFLYLAFGTSSETSGYLHEVKTAKAWIVPVTTIEVKNVSDTMWR